MKVRDKIRDKVYQIDLFDTTTKITRRIRMKKTGLSTLALLFACLFTAQAQATEEHKMVLDLQPIGYWPLDEGGGSLIKDFSKTANHATNYNVPWKNGILDFTGAYQWLQVPESMAYMRNQYLPKAMTEPFSIGLWVFTRSEARYGADVNLFGNPEAFPVTGDFISIRLRGRYARDGSTEGIYLNVVSGGVDDALNTVADGITIESDAWQHIFITYDDLIARIYINGKLASTRLNKIFRRCYKPFFMGSDARALQVHPPLYYSLDGSLAQVMLLDSWLSDDQVAKVVEATRPAVTPPVLTADTVRVHGEYVSFQELHTLSHTDRLEALRHMARRDVALFRNSAPVMDFLAACLADGLTRSDAAELLGQINTDRSTEILKNAVPDWVAIACDATASKQDRAAAAIALGKTAALTTPYLAELTATLNEIAAKDGVHIPRIEDLHRNALIDTLLILGAGDPDTRAVLGRVYAKPLLEAMDLSKPAYAPVKALLDQGKYLDALDAAAKVKPEDRQRFLSQNDIYRDSRASVVHNRAYTFGDTHNGTTIRFGNGYTITGSAVEPVNQEAYEKAVAYYTAKYPHLPVKGFNKGKIDDLYRAVIVKIAPDGTEQKEYFGGEHFIFNGRDGKVRAWSVAVDNDGYVHVTGGQHNRPHIPTFMPGALEEMGIAAALEGPKAPNNMYWVSKQPMDITAFEFVGHNDNPRDFKAYAMEYANFIQDNHGRLYLYSRSWANGYQAWGFYRYDTATRRWTNLGGKTEPVVNAAIGENPGWEKCLRGLELGREVWLPLMPEEKPYVWGIRPSFYNYSRTNQGIKFDPDNRMISHLEIRGLDQHGRLQHSEIFAYSDDCGDTFHRADGTPVRTPLTNNPATDYHASMDEGLTRTWYQLWRRLILNSGLKLQ